MKKTLNKILHIVVDVLIVMILIVSVLILTITLTSQSNLGVPNILGNAPIAVLTDSMKGDAPDDFSAGDLIICKVVDDPLSASYKEGDVVTFKYDIDSNNQDDFVTHRIYKVNADGTYLTKGDNNVNYDQNENNQVVFPNISNSDIVATYSGTKISGLGSVINYLQTSMGFFLCVLLPMIIFFLYQAVRVVINVISYNKEKALEQAQATIAAASDLTEEQKKKAIEEYLASQKEENKEE